MMTFERLSDLDELVLRCRNEQAREYIAEAVACYKTGAYRACIVSTWIAIVFDLIDKVRELSVSGDKDAEILLKQFETYQQQMNDGNSQGVKNALEFERDILMTVRDKFQFFDQQQYLDLYRLREDRHRCAHPSFQRIEEPYRATAELARLHLRNAIYHVLQEPPVQGKSALTQLGVLVSSQYFPTDLNEAIAQLKSSPFGRPNEPLVRAFVDMLVFRFFEDDDKLKYSPKVLSALNAALEMQRDVVEKRLKKQMNKVILYLVEDKDVGGAAYMALLIKDIWPLLEQPAKDKINQFILYGPTNEVIALLHHACTVQELLPSAQERIARLEINELTYAIAKYNLGKPAVPKAIDLFASAGSWVRANEVADKLIIPIIPYLTRDDVEEILKSPSKGGNDLLGSIGFDKFITKIRESGLMSTRDLDNMLIENNLEQYAENIPDDEVAQT